MSEQNVDTDKVVVKLKKEIEKANVSIEVLQWTQCLRNYLIAISLDCDLKRKLNS